ncbi:cytosolic endo-beta-N-acetylglucosaminidase isoform X2 [Oratosquilla oratoria]|uniref:cytosolic endo-beta-N-acetylglucosaminidase isoform X2 n=1 Tax=Oratosquilla oratoria TaxID=337810 RepID=UPI003F76BBDA
MVSEGTVLEGGEWEYSYYSSKTSVCGLTVVYGVIRSWLIKLAMDGGKRVCEKGVMTPLKTLQELLLWEPEPSHSKLPVTKLKTRYPTYKETRQRTLVCHDMKGGYLEDRFIHGCENKDAYRFYHWSCIDSFVYFSHNFVTIPPVGWITAGHTHGVLVMGTIITEWDPGAELCKQMFKDSETVNSVVKKLVAIAEFYGFNGWLVNIENKIETDQIGHLEQFMKQLTEKMHKVCPGSQVVWYDSVDSQGKLNNQSELNKSNRMFFDACDGMFLDYKWTDKTLEKSRDEAGDRTSDVYVGIDVFGRGKHAGGFDTYKAFEALRAHKLSAAVFAPGWTYETKKLDEFDTAEKKLWGACGEFLFPHGPAELPFRTSFCQGYGIKKNKCGVNENGDWHNLALQEYQPNWAQCARDVDLSQDLSEAYLGGSSLSISTCRASSVELFVCRLQWQGQLNVAVMYKWKGPEVPLTLHLLLEPTTKIDEVIKQKRSVLWECALDSPQTCPDSLLQIETTKDVLQNSWISSVVRIPAEEGLHLGRISLSIGGKSCLLLGEIVIKDVTKA